MENKTSDYSVQDELFSKTKYVTHVQRRITFFKKKGSIIKPVEINSNVITTSGGALVLPYFKDGQGQWKVILVSQFRPAVMKRTLEAPGGRLDKEPPQVALSRELLEETGIKVNPKSIKVIVNEYTLPSVLSTQHIGGIVEICQQMVKNKKIAGKNCENEWTQVEVFDLIEIMKKREANLVMLDIMTSRLVDEVAKTVGMLVKKY